MSADTFVGGAAASPALPALFIIANFLMSSDCSGEGRPASGEHWFALVGPRMAFSGRHDDHRTFELVTSTCSDITGYTADELVGGRLGLLDMICPADREHVRNEVRRSVVHHLPLEVDYRIRAKDGSWILVSEFSRPNISADGRVKFTGFIGLALARRPWRPGSFAAAA